MSKKEQITKKTVEKIENPVPGDKQTVVTGSIMDKVFSPSSEQTKTTSESEDVAMIIREWLDKRHITRKTRYSKRQVIAVSILQSLANTYKIKTLDRFLTEFRTSKLSEDGKSSSELENILKARLPTEEDADLKKLTKFLE